VDDPELELVTLNVAETLTDAVGVTVTVGLPDEVDEPVDDPVALDEPEEDEVGDVEGLGLDSGEGVLVEDEVAVEEAVESDVQSPRPERRDCSQLYPSLHEHVDFIVIEFGDKTFPLTGHVMQLERRFPIGVYVLPVHAMQAKVELPER